MANINKRLPENVSGEYFVDSTCIHCSSCANIAPELFVEAGKYYVVGRQPEGPEELRLAMQALICCPLGAIGTVNRAAIKEVMGDFPQLIEDEVYFCGFNSPKTAGAASYFIKHPAGNWLICSPKFLPQLTGKFEEMGGISYIFETHRDDVGDARKYREKFGSKIIIHRNEIDAEPDADLVIDGTDPVEISPGFLVIPQPGHTEGHMMLLFKDKFLFSGDELKPDPVNHLLNTWDPLWTWYSFETQADSVKLLARYRFQWILPSHGKRMQVDESEIGAMIAGAVERARAIKDTEPHTRQRVDNLNMYAESLREWGQTAHAQKIEERARKVASELAPA